MPAIEIRPGPGIRGARDVGRALRSLYLKLIHVGVKKYVSSPGEMSSLGYDTFKAALSGAIGGLGILLTRWLNSLPPRMALQIQAAARRLPDPPEIEMADFNSARRAIVSRTASELGVSSEALGLLGFDMGGIVGTSVFSNIVPTHKLAKDLAADSHKEHPIADAIHDVEEYLWHSLGLDKFGFKDPSAHASDDEPDAKRQKTNPVASAGGDFSGLVRTFYNPTTSRIIGYKGIRRKRRFSSLERYSPFWKDQNRLTQQSVLVGPSQA